MTSPEGGKFYIKRISLYMRGFLALPLIHVFHMGVPCSWPDIVFGVTCYHIKHPTGDRVLCFPSTLPVGQVLGTPLYFPTRRVSPRDFRKQRR